MILYFWLSFSRSSRWGRTCWRRADTSWRRCRWPGPKLPAWDRSTFQIQRYLPWYFFFSISLRPAFPCQISLPSHFRTIFRAINRQCVAYCITIQNFLTKVISRTRNQSNETIRVLIRVKSSCLLLLLFARVASFGIQKFKLLSTDASLSAPPS